MKIVYLIIFSFVAACSDKNDINQLIHNNYSSVQLVDNKTKEQIEKDAEALKKLREYEAESEQKLNNQDSYEFECDKDDLTTFGMKQCANKELAEVTKKFNTTYELYKQSLVPQQQNVLDEVQKAWIVYKDLQCEFAGSDFEGGSYESLEIALCLTSFTRQRLEEFEQKLELNKEFSR